MLKGNLVTLLATSCSTFFLMIVWSIWYFGDDLFFHSDMMSQLVFLSALALLSTLVVMVLLTPFLIWNQYCWLVRLRRFAEGFFLVLLLSCSAWFGLQLFVLRKLEEHMPKAHIWAVIEGIMLVGLLIIIYCFLRRPKSRDVMVRRSTALAWIVFVVAGAVTLFSLLSGVLARHSRQTPEKHFVLVILDRCPAQCFSTFNPLAHLRYHDFVHSAGRVYVNVHTSLPYTWGYFGTLYQGTTTQNGSLQGDLLTTLQADGIRTRVLADHRNALPEGSSLRVSRNQGLRSTLLKSFMCPLMNLLNLDYSLNYTPSYTSRMDGLLSLFPEWLSSRLRVRDSANRFDEFLFPEIERIRKVARKSFLVFHTDWQTGESLSLGPESYLDEREDVRQQIRRRDYHYTPQESWYADLFAARFDVVADHLLCRMSEFLSEMASKGLLNNTVVLFTSDHGTISRDGRMWYGYHPQEEVLRVVTVAYGDIEPGIDMRLLSTPDISQTILDYFGIENRLDPEACSLLTTKERAFTASLTLRSDINKEQFLVIYKQNMKYLFNLHPLGNGECMLERFESAFSLETVATGQAALSDAAGELLQAMSDFGIAHETTNHVHHLFTRENLERVSLGHGHQELRRIRTMVGNESENPAR